MAASLDLAVREDVCLAVRGSDDGSGLVPVVHLPAVDELLDVRDGTLLVYDRRTGEGVASLAEIVRTRAEQTGTELPVTGVETLEHVIGAAFGGNAWRHAGPSDPASVEPAAAKLFDVVLHPWTNPIGWPALAAVATGRLLLAGDDVGASVKW